MKLLAKIRAVIDTDVLISLCKVARLDLIRDWPGVAFYTTDVNLRELEKPESRQCVATAIKSGILNVVNLTEPDALVDFANARKRIGDGEAAVVAVVQFGGDIAITNDVRGRKLATARQPPIKVASVEDILARCLEAGRLSFAEVANLVVEFQEAREFVPFAKALPTPDSLRARVTFLPPIATAAPVAPA